jgi:hypothetical protein
MLELWFREFIDTPAAQSGGIAVPLVAQTAQ